MDTKPLFCLALLALGLLLAIGCANNDVLPAGDTDDDTSVTENDETTDPEPDLSEEESADVAEEDSADLTQDDDAEPMEEEPAVCSDDDAENDDDPDAAHLLNDGDLMEHRVARFEDDDYFVFTGCAQGTARITLRYDISQGNADLDLLDDQRLLIERAQTVSSNESIRYNVAAGQTYYLRVFAPEAQGCVPYTMELRLTGCAAPDGDETEADPEPPETDPAADQDPDDDLTDNQDPDPELADEREPDPEPDPEPAEEREPDPDQDPEQDPEPEEEADLCPEGACHNHGACNQSTGACTCDIGFDGDDCERCDDGFGSYPYCVARVTVPGQVLITEIMHHPDNGLDDAFAQWVEIANLTVFDLSLEGCALADDLDGRDLEPVLLEGGGYALLAASLDTGRNGGLAADDLLGVRLSHDGDLLVLSCQGIEMDRVDFRPGHYFSGEKAHSLSLSPERHDAQSNDLGFHWCPAPETNPYWTHPDDPARQNYGTPRTANIQCPDQDFQVDWCRLQHPATADLPTGAYFQVYGRVYDEGITDVSPATDPSPRLLAQAGYGPQGSQPHAADSQWVWTEAQPNDGYTDTGAGEPGNDEYRALLSAPAAGAYNLAFRFSLNGGFSWLYCDLAKGYGHDGSEDGYQAGDAGRLSAFDAPVPGPGQALITEVMYRPQGRLAGTAAQWVELYNPGDDTLVLTGCALSTSHGEAAALDGLYLSARSFLVLAGSIDPALNGEVDAARALAFSLDDQGDDVSLMCEDLVDAVSYLASSPWPDDDAHSISLDPSGHDPRANDQPWYWCSAATRYYDAQGPDDRDHYGTPGTANPACGGLDVTIDWCRLQAPTMVSVSPDQVTTYYGRVYEAGLTDRSSGVDQSSQLVAAAGFGPMGTLPLGNSAWRWFDATPNVGWVDTEGGEPGNDEYQAAVTAPASAGSYHTAFRVSFDGGVTWTYCDTNFGLNHDGSEDGYQAGAAGSMTVH